MLKKLKNLVIIGVACMIGLLVLYFGMNLFGINTNGNLFERTEMQQMIFDVQQSVVGFTYIERTEIEMTSDLFINFLNLRVGDMVTNAKLDVYYLINNYSIDNGNVININIKDVKYNGFHILNTNIYQQSWIKVNLKYDSMGSFINDFNKVIENELISNLKNDVNYRNRIKNIISNKLYSELSNKYPNLKFNINMN